MAVLLLLLVLLTGTAQAEPAALILANNYSDKLNLNDYWVSEKYDGYRAYWDGQQLLSRAGNRFLTPDWFVANFPKQPMDGELWLGRGQFQALASVVKSADKDDPRWRQVRFMVFDLPAEQGSFDQRLTRLNSLLQSRQITWLVAVQQDKIASTAVLMEHLKAVVTSGAEGLMLHRGSSLYRGGRSDDLIKLKQYDDAEGVVVAHLPGKGKYLGAMGSLRVVLPSGIHFKVGSGFTDAERHDPPVIGAKITYRYNGLTDQGLPRFARFIRLYQPL